MNVLNYVKKIYGQKKVNPLQNSIIKCQKFTLENNF